MTFRNDLDEQWAVFFDTLGLEWEYLSVADVADFKVEYPDDGAHYFKVTKSLKAMTQEEWENALRVEDLTILDGEPALLMYVRPRECLLPHARYTDGVADMPERPYRIAPDAKRSVHRAGWALWSYKERPWWDEPSNFFEIDFIAHDPWCVAVQELTNAVLAAKRSK